jgi:pyruvate dehydrogenase E2 component (dihydrolipoamide acetyltransferase)
MEGKLIEQTRMRAGIARRMVESKQQAPHFYAETEIAIDAVRDHLAELNADTSAPRTTMTVALIRGCVTALLEHPQLNSVWTPDGLLQADQVNLGIAIALEDGLVAPALLGAGDLDTPATAAALRDLGERARVRRLRPAEMTDATFTLSNLGMFEVTGFTAIVTPPQVGILATSRPVERCVLVDGEPRTLGLMTVTLSSDHRAVDGVDAARFLTTFKHAMEDPETLLSGSYRPKEATP